MIYQKIKFAKNKMPASKKKKKRLWPRIFILVLQEFLSQNVFSNYGYIEQIFVIKKFLFNTSIYSSFTVKGFVSFGGTQLVWSSALSISYKSPIGLVKLQPIIPSLKKCSDYLCLCQFQILQQFLDFCHIPLQIVIWETLFIICVLNEI